MRSKVARFYSWSHNDIDALSYADFLIYYKAIDRIEAQEMLMKMQISDYPNMKTENRTKFHRKLVEISNGSVRTEVVRSDKFAEMLGGHL